MKVTVQGHHLDMAVEPGIRPTVFSLFMANMIRVASNDRVAVDAGAGGGIISIILAKLGVSRVIAIERSARACELLERNAEINGVARRIEIIQDDLSTCEISVPVNLIVSNPPTVPHHKDLPEYARGGGSDGLSFLSVLVERSAVWLNESDGNLQLVVSSLVNRDAFYEMCESANMTPSEFGSIVVPLRDFYPATYGSHSTDTADGEDFLYEKWNGGIQFHEAITAYHCMRR